MAGLKTATLLPLPLRENLVQKEKTSLHTWPLTDKIFGLFERLHGPHEYEGTGVGLAIVRLVMDKHGGRVTVDSAPGRGSRFSLVFPQGAA